MMLFTECHTPEISCTSTSDLLISFHSSRLLSSADVHGAFVGRLIDMLYAVGWPLGLWMPLRCRYQLNLARIILS